MDAELKVLREYEQVIRCSENGPSLSSSIKPCIIKADTFAQRLLINNTVLFMSLLFSSSLLYENKQLEDAFSIHPL
jgi:hypothetical protein